MSEVIKRDQHGYKIYPLLDGSEVLWAEEDRVLFHRSSPESMPLTTDPDGVFEDLLALVDSLQEQVNNLNEESLANFRTAAERGKQLAERDRTIARLRKALEEARERCAGRGVKTTMLNRQNRKMRILLRDIRSEGVGDKFASKIDIALGE